MSATTQEAVQASPKLISTINLPEPSALCLARTSDYIFAGLPSGTIRCFSAKSLHAERDLCGHEGSVLSLICVDIGRHHWLISASADSTVRVWDAKKLKCLWSIFPPHEATGDILSVAFINGRIVYGTQSCALMWTDLPQSSFEQDGYHTPVPAGRYNKFFDSQPALDLSRAQASAHGRLYSSLHELTLVSSRSSAGSDAHSELPVTNDEHGCAVAVDPADTVIAAHCGYIYALESANLANRDVLISGSGDGSIKIWANKKDGLYYLQSLLEEDEDAVLSLAVKDNVTLYAGLQGGTIRIFDLTTFSTIRILSSGPADVLALCIAGDSCLATTASGQLQTWNSSFTLVDNIQAHSEIALSCASSTSGAYLYSGGNDATIKVWQAMSANTSKRIQSESLQGRLFTLLGEFIQYKSISSDELHREDCRQAALWCRDTLANLGADATILPGAARRNPIVSAKFAKRDKPKKPRKRILFYGHYDVVSDLGKWKSGDAFRLTGIDGYLYGRGVIDNKGPILAVACAAADLLDEGNLDVDILMLLEGEEETDSAGFQNTVRAYAKDIGHIDAVLVSNSYSLSEGIPSIMFGLRGRINLTVSVESRNPDLHSGMHGGISHEPLIDLMRVVGTLVDPATGDVAVKDFYDRVRPLDNSEAEAYEQIVNRCPPSAIEPLIKHSHFADPKECLMKAWRYPSLSIHKIDVSGSSISSIIPSRAQAKVSIRTVPDMPLRATAASIIQHLETAFSQIASTNRIEVSIDSNAPWWIADRQHPYSKAAEQAVFDEWQVQPIWIREGGSLPSLPFLESVFNATTVHLPMGCQGDHAHLVDEKTSITNLQRGKKVVENWLRAMSSVDESSSN